MKDCGLIADIPENSRRDLTAGVAVDAARVDVKITGNVIGEAQRSVGHGGVNASNGHSILVVLVCDSRQARVVIGGEWARGGSGTVGRYLRFRTLRGFERWLRTQ